MKKQEFSISLNKNDNNEFATFNCWIYYPLQFKALRSILYDKTLFEFE